MYLPLSLPELWLAVAGLVFAGLVKGITGIGYATCAMPLLAIAVGLEKALALIVVPAIVSNAAVLLGGGNLGGTLARFRRFYVGILPGIACGTALLGHVDPQAATQGLALLTLFYVVLAVTKPRLALPARLEQPLALPAGILNGVLTALTGSQILPLVPYMLALRLDADTQALAINLAVTIGSLALGAALAAAGILTADLLVVSCAAAIPAISGTLAGNALRGRLSVERVRRLTLVVLVVVAATLGGRPALEATLATVCGPAAEAALANACLGAIEAARSVFTLVADTPPPP